MGLRIKNRDRDRMEREACQQILEAGAHWARRRDNTAEGFYDKVKAARKLRRPASNMLELAEKVRADMRNRRLNSHATIDVATLLELM